MLSSTVHTKILAHQSKNPSPSSVNKSNDTSGILPRRICVVARELGEEQTTYWVCDAM
jgi:hypothetical protein